MSQNTTSQPSSLSPPSQQLVDLFSSPQSLIMFGLVGLLLILKVFEGPIKPKGARFATQRELKRARNRAIKQMQARYKRPTAVGYVLDNELREGFTDVQTSKLFLGAVKTGKTFFGINPTVKALMDRGDSIVLYDYKYPGQTEKLIGYAESVGYQREDIHVFAPSFPESCIFNPVEEATVDYARTIAETIVQNFSKTGENDPFFGPAGISLTEAVLTLAREIGGDISTCQAILSRSNLTKRIKNREGQINSWTSIAFSQFLATAKSEKTASSIAGTAALNFDRFVKPHLASAFMGKSNLPLRLDGKKIIILGSRYKYRHSIKPILAVVLQAILDNNVFFGRKTPLAVVLDEFPTLYLPSIVEQIAALREYGVYFIFGVQNVGQVELTYGEKEAQAILGSTRTKVCYNPNEPKSAEYISGMVGKTEVIEREVSRNYSSGKVSRNKSKRRETVPLLPAEDILGFDEGVRVVFTEAIKGTKSKPLSKDGLKHRKRAFIPYITDAAPNEECIAAFDLSVERWPTIRDDFIRNSTQVPIGHAWIKRQVEKVEFLLPESSEGSDEASPQDEFADFAESIFAEDERDQSFFSEVV